MFNLILFGPPGSGKGTQSNLLIKQYGFLHISTGELLRDEVSKATPLGIEAKKFMDEGQLVPDKVVIGMIDTKLKSNAAKNGIIFDGFPRTVTQAEALDRLMTLDNTQINILLSLEVPEDELRQRLLQRGALSGRHDDNEKTIAKRIVEYKKKTKEVADYYENQDKLLLINGTGGVNDIFDSINKAIASHVSPLI